ncbi:MAG: hypothetical protein RR846_07835 [Oscillospiraceae bacterium]
MENAQQIEETKVVPAPESAQKGSETEKTYTEADILQLKSAWETEAKANAEKAE